VVGERPVQSHPTKQKQPQLTTTNGTVLDAVPDQMAVVRACAWLAIGTRDQFSAADSRRARQRLERREAASPNTCSRAGPRPWAPEVEPLVDLEPPRAPTSKVFRCGRWAIVGSSNDGTARSAYCFANILAGRASATAAGRRTTRRTSRYGRRTRQLGRQAESDRQRMRRRGRRRIDRRRPASQTRMVRGEDQRCESSPLADDRARPERGRRESNGCASRARSTGSIGVATRRVAPCRQVGVSGHRRVDGGDDLLCSRRRR
jgi:hypothetical protein